MQTGMPVGPGDEGLRALAEGLRAAAARTDARRAALGRYALVWWQGAAAERYAQQVAHRVAALAALAHDMEQAAGLVEAVRMLTEEPSGPSP